MRDTRGWGAALLGLLIWSAMASAREVPPSEGGESDWRVSTGLGVVWRPEVQGSRVHKTQLFPVVNVEQRDGWFLDVQQGAGKKWVLAPGWRLETFLAPGARRDEDSKLERDQTLNGMGVIPSVAQFGLGLVYQQAEWRLSAKVLQSLKREQQGRQLVLDADYTLLQRSDVGVTLNASLSAGDQDDMQRWFGVSAEQSARSGFAAYQAGGGWRQAKLGATVRVPLDKHWQLIGQAAYLRSLGSAADSPLVKVRRNGQASGVLQYTW